MEDDGKKKHPKQIFCIGLHYELGDKQRKFQFVRYKRIPIMKVMKKLVIQSKANKSLASDYTINF